MAVKQDKEEQQQVVELLCAVQNYDWGIQGADSLVGQIYAANSGKKLDEEKPYAELWMGTHESGPSMLKADNSKLKDLLAGQDLPFLFKVLSVRKALSIQAHPDLTLAPILNARDPKNYKDANHKPEMTLALTEFEALCGFRTVKEILELVRVFEGVKNVLGEEAVKKMEDSLGNQASEREALKFAFTKLMNGSIEGIKQGIEEIQRMNKDVLSLSNQTLLDLFNRLNNQYPQDIGVFCVFFMHYLKMQPGQAIFLAANEPHAYLSGDCVECMATSDNVVRAGLTPKFRDVETLCEMLTYRMFEGVEEVFNEPKVIEGRGNARAFLCPVDEFAVTRIELNKQGDEDYCEGEGGPSIILCTAGSAELRVNEELLELSVGRVFYLPPRCPFNLVNKSDGRCLIFQAYQPTK